MLQQDIAKPVATWAAADTLQRHSLIRVPGIMAERRGDDLIEFLEHLGPRAHVVAVRQPTVAALAAASVMAAGDHAAQPATLTLMAGPIDTRVARTRAPRSSRQRFRALRY